MLNFRQLQKTEGPRKKAALKTTVSKHLCQRKTNQEGRLLDSWPPALYTLNHITSHGAVCVAKNRVQSRMDKVGESMTGEGVPERVGK